MKVLLLSFFHPELVRGGAQQVCYELFQDLKTRSGVTPYLLASVDPSFASLFKNGARITGFDQRDNEYLFLSRGYDYLWHKAGDPLLIEAYADFLRMVQPDVVHVHHFMLFGLDLLTLTRRVLPDTRIVFTFHEFMTICQANGHMVRTFDKSLCTHASPVRCHQCFPDRGPEQFFTREMWVKRHLDVVDVFTTPSRFMIEHFVRWGVAHEKIRHVTNGQQDYSGGVLLPDDGRTARNRFGFFGQLVDAKGVHVILRAVEQLRVEGFTNFRVELNGDNLRYATDEFRKNLEEVLERDKRLPFSAQLIVMNGSYEVSQLPQRMARVDWCIVPSTWWEIFGLVISEAKMFRRPVIVSNVGGPAERIRDEVDGLHFSMGDSDSLALTMRRACTEDGLWDRLVSNIVPPPSRSMMTDKFVELYKMN